MFSSEALIRQVLDLKVAPCGAMRARASCGGGRAHAGPGVAAARRMGAAAAGRAAVAAAVRESARAREATAKKLRHAMSKELVVRQQDKLGWVLQAERDWQGHVQQLVHERGLWPVWCDAGTPGHWDAIAASGPGALAGGAGAGPAGARESRAGAGEGPSTFTPWCSGSCAPQRGLTECARSSCAAKCMWTCAPRLV